jgi:protein transport protein SEC23
VFRGSKEYTGKQIQDMLGLSGGGGGASQNLKQPQQVGVSGAARFLQPVSECEFALTTILEQLLRDPWPVANDRRPLRCTGTALGVAIGLIEAANQNGGALVMLFCGGAPTEGN